MGEVWYAYDERLDRRVAVKFMLAESASIPQPQDPFGLESLETRRARFLREIQTTASIAHSGVPAIHDAGTDEGTGRLFVVMQLLTGRELKTLIEEADDSSKPLPITWAAAIGAQIASTLDEVHRHDVVHRDIKPANLMLTPGGIVKVLDFGVAALLGVGSTNLRLTQVGMTVGTPPYMSPEQSLANAVGPAGDVYALACVLYELLTGRTPFTAGGGKSYSWHHVRTSPPPIRSRRGDVPIGLEQLLLDMLAKEAEDRPTAAGVYDRLLPWAKVQESADYSVRLLRAANPGLDPCEPFGRPFGSGIRAAAQGREFGYMPPREDAPAALRVQAGLSDEEVEQLTDKVSKLAGEGRIAQAADLLRAALARENEVAVSDTLTSALAHVLFLGGIHREAADLFEQLSASYASRFGLEDEEAQLCSYYAAQCRAELGEVTAAISGFLDFTGHEPDPLDQEAVSRHLDALAILMRLHAAQEDFTQARAAARTLRTATVHFLGPTGHGLVQLDAYLARLDALEQGEGRPDR